MYAFTELHNDYPAFVNLSEQPDGTLKLSVRTRGNGGKEYASIALAPDVAEELAEAIFKHVHADEAPVAQPVTPLQAPDQAQEPQKDICKACDGKGGWVTDSWIDPVSGPECEGERCGDCDGTGFEVGATAEASELPPLPLADEAFDKYNADGTVDSEPAYTSDQMRSYALAAIKAMAPQDSAKVDAK